MMVAQRVVTVVIAPELGFCVASRCPGGSLGETSWMNWVAPYCLVGAREQLGRRRRLLRVPVPVLRSPWMLALSCTVDIVLPWLIRQPFLAMGETICLRQIG